MKITVISLGIIVIITFVIIFFTRPQTQITPFQTPTPSPTPVEEKVDIKASFSIITGSTVRSFNAEKYHNQSHDVFISKDDPTKVHVKKKGITWDDFFKTLPMKLTKDCLTTGDGETFCDGKEGTLMFYLNGVEFKDLLNKEINQGDSILIKFTSS